MDYHKMIAGAVSGFVAAAMIDYDAYRKHEGGFSFKRALVRWIAGAASGAAAAVGIGVTQ